jgi:hypothetical protein
MMPTLNLDAKSPDGASVLVVIPYVTADGVPNVVVYIKKNAAGVFDATLDGQPALAIVLGENESGNAPWTVGDLLVDSWQKAKKLVGR